MPIIQGTPVSVDHFSYKEGVFIFLLSHFHSDHLGGLTPSWNLGTIYCTEVTKRFVLKEYNLNEAVVKSIPLGERTKIYLDNIGKEYMTVTLIDANHCPGSVMFLMEGYFGTFLHTGDFRVHDGYFSSNAIMRHVGKIDRLYLDDTYSNPIAVFPRREDVGEEIRKILSEECGRDTLVVVAVDTLGKEELLTAIAFLLQSPVIVSRDRYRTLEILSKLTNLNINLFTTDKKLGRIVALGKRDVTREKVRKLLENEYNWFNRVVGIYPSGLFCDYYKKKRKNGGNIPKNELVYRLPYTLHSSYDELERFMKFVKTRELYSASKHNNWDLRRVFGKFVDPKGGTEKGRALAEGKTSIPLSVLNTMKRRSHEKSTRKKKSKYDNRTIKKILRRMNGSNGTGVKLKKSKPQNRENDVIVINSQSEEEEEGVRVGNYREVGNNEMDIIDADLESSESSMEAPPQIFDEIISISSSEEFQGVRTPPRIDRSVKQLPKSFWNSLENKENCASFEVYTPEKRNEKRKKKRRKKKKKKNRSRKNSKKVRKRRREKEILDVRGKRKKRKISKRDVVVVD